MRLLKILHLAVIVTLFPSCALIGPDFSRPTVEMPAQYSGTTLSQDKLVISDKWWTLYEDSTLNTLIDKALRNNTDIKRAVARIEETDGFAREVGTTLFPQFDLDGSAAHSRVTQLGATPQAVISQPVRNNFRATVGTSFEIDFWGKLRRAKESARAQALSSRYAKDTVSLSLTSLIVNNYLQLRSLEAQITLSRDNLNSRNESLALTRRRLDGGIASNLDVQQAQVASSNLTAQIVELERQREIIFHQLALLTGDLDLTLAESNIKNLPIPPTPPAGLPSSLLESRPDVAQAEEDLVSANANIGVAKAALYPTISLTGFFGGESKDLGDILKSAARIWSTGVSLKLPIFDFGRLNSRVDQVTAVQKQVLASYEGAVQKAFTEVNDALVNVRQNSEREIALDRSQKSAKEALRISENRYKSGYTTYLEVLDAQRVYNDASISFIQSRQARLTASVGLFKALGGGWKASQLIDTQVNSTK